MIKTFRGLMADDAQDTILLHTNDGSTGYRIVKFQIITKTPYDTNAAEHIIKIYKIPQTAVDGVVDFSDQTLLGVATINNNTAGYQYPITTTIVFDREIFNQDLYITHKEAVNAEPCNYYFELEQIKLDINSNTVATLKDMRNTASPRP